MASKELLVGLSISDRGIQAVEIERNGPATTLLAIDEWENTFPLNGSSEKGMQQFQEYLSAFMKVNHVKARRASVALDTALLFMNSIPMEDGLTRVEINEHINWELRQYFPDTPAKEFITDVHVLTRHETDRWNEVLSVTVKRQDVYRVQKAMAELGLDLHILDADHFSADMALRVNYPDTYRKYLALVGVKENRLDISLMRNGNLESYSYCSVQSNQEIVEQIAKLS